MHGSEIAHLGLLGMFQKLFTKVFYVLVISSSMLNDQAIEFLSGKGNPSLILTAGTPSLTRADSSRQSQITESDMIRLFSINVTWAPSFR